MRNAFAKALYECALADERIYILAADISPAGPLVQFAKDFPRRFINVGVAEQAMIGMAAGLALKGMRPFCYTIATFALYRPFEFIRDDIAYQNLPVTVVGMGAGLNYSTLGATHHAIEDVAVASAIPGMRVLAPCDPTETQECVRWCATEAKGPTYLRIGKEGEPDLVLAAPMVVKSHWRFGYPRLIRHGDSESCCILSYGPICSAALEVAESLHNADVYSYSTLKPIIADSWFNRYKEVFVIEEHVRSGGLGEKLGLPSFCLKDEFVHYHGERDELLRRHGLTAEQIVAKLNEKRDIPRHATRR